MRTTIAVISSSNSFTDKLLASRPTDYFHHNATGVYQYSVAKALCSSVS